VIGRTAPDIVIWMVNLNTLWGQDAFNYQLATAPLRYAKDVQP
jgi:hypothetical protein